MNIAESYLETVFSGDAPFKIVVSKPPKDCEYIKINLLKKEHGYQAEKYTEKQVFHENLPDAGAAKSCCGKLLGQGWKQLNSWGNVFEYSLMVSKKGAVSLTKKRVNGPLQRRSCPTTR